MAADAQNFADEINALHPSTWAGILGLHVVRANRDEVVAEVTVRPEHHQPHGIVHGGVHASIIESVASIGAAIDSMGQNKTVVGLENHTSFVRAVREGKLLATAKPLTRGRRTQLWEVAIVDAHEKLVATGRVRLLVMDGEADVAGAALGVKPA